ncbi:hypothetical protein NBM05_13820 [Rothia sp. AR01]|uniref:Uncharacterized protein n=1 Tax=Rothia santali TaxID=2949643 RepID=A0A9X2KJC0_9MICC|nr:hypothetical protein [Rothia santali]MCP3427058.1 hypothetical protein [Rothia santali]
MTSRPPENTPDEQPHDAAGARSAGEGGGGATPGPPPTTQMPAHEAAPSAGSAGGGAGASGYGASSSGGSGSGGYGSEPGGSGGDHGGYGPGSGGGTGGYAYAGATGPAPAKSGRSKMKRVGGILAIVGGALLVVSVVAAVIMAVTGIGGAVSEAQNSTRVDGSGSVEIQADEQMQVYIRDGAGAPMCNISGPAGASIEEGTPQESSFTSDGTTWTSYTSFTVSESGTYDMVCSGGEVMVGPPVSVSGIATGVGGILIGVFGGGLGFILLVVGLVLFFVGRSRERAARA